MKNFWRTIQVSVYLRRFGYASAPGGYTLYWAAVIGIILMAGYLVGGLIPKRFPDVSQYPRVNIKPTGFTDTNSSIQLRKLDQEGAVQGATTQAPERSNDE